MSEYTADIDGKPQTASVSAVAQDAVVDAPRQTVTVAPVAEPTDTGPTVVDDFEDGDIAEYTGDTAAWGVDTTAPVFEGAYSAKCATEGAEVVSTSGLDAYPDQGETMAAQVWGDHTGSLVGVGVSYFAQDVDNHYLAQAIVADDRLTLHRKEAGGFTKLAEATVTVTSQTEYQLRATPQSDGTHTVGLYDAAGDTHLASLSATDTTFTSGGVGLRQGSGGSVAVDHLRLI